MSSFFFFFFGSSFLGTQRILSVWRCKYFFSFVKIFFTYLLKYHLSSLDCFFSFSNACLCVHYNFCIYLWSSYICSVVSVLAFLLLQEIFLHLFFQASLYFLTVPYSFSARLLRSLRWRSCFWVWAMAGQLSVELGALLQLVFCWWLPAPSLHTHTQRAGLIFPYLQCWSPGSDLLHSSNYMSYRRPCRKTRLSVGKFSTSHPSFSALPPQAPPRFLSYKGSFSHSLEDNIGFSSTVNSLSPCEGQMGVCIFSVGSPDKRDSMGHIYTKRIIHYLSEIQI